jgi:GNAT superfamily N-acetyltransferase
MKFRFSKRSKATDSFRASAIMGKYDIESKDIIEKFEGELPIETLGKWNVGVIYGNSGTGKTSIARNLFENDLFEWENHSARSVIDDFPESVSTDDLAKAFNSVGFTTAKSWLKPYSVLSNGEKMRVDLARAIVDNKKLIVFDEFTSVVDRRVAKVGAFAVQKAIRRLDKQFIAVTCHEDVLTWLEPDWTFCTDNMKFTFTRGELRRPKIEIGVYRASGFWEIFRKYHYMNFHLLGSAHQYVAVHEGNPVAFCAIVNLVHNRVKNGMRMHRLVVLPDYQGISIGHLLTNFVADVYKRKGYRVFGTLSHPAQIKSMSRDANWRLQRNYSHASAHGGKVTRIGSCRRLTVSFEYEPRNKESQK